MDEFISELDAARTMLGTISITSTRKNMNALLASMQAIDRVITGLQKIVIAGKEASDNECDKG